MALSKEQIAQRIAQEVKEGFYVNLGIGIPTLVANFVRDDIEVDFQSENGVLGMGPFPFEGEEDPVVQIIQESNGSTVYTVRIDGNTFRPKVFEAGKYTVKVGEGNRTKKLQGVESIGINEKKSITVELK